jgi:uracil-DNA glycosylase
MELIENSWKPYFEKEYQKKYFQELNQFIKNEYQTKNIFPPREDIFNAFKYTDLKDLKVLILGQDPYHGEKQAHGLAFSVLPDIAIPKSLVNIYKELQNDLDCKIPNNGYLKQWADQGVLMLNTVLTVEAHQANSHKNQGWEIFTDAMISALNEQDRPIVILLWGKPAQKKRKLLTNEQHFIIETPHPSPLSAYRGFFDSKCFSRCNKFLMDHGLEPIDWQIKDI